MITTSFAEHFAKDWIHAWNSHDLNQVLSHYHDDFEMNSPLISKIAGEASGKLLGKSAVSSYWQQALAMVPDLKLELISVLVGVGSITLYYKSVGGKLAAETFHFDEQLKVIKAYAHYQLVKTL